MILAVDPGDKSSAWVLYDEGAGQLVDWAKQPNDDVLRTVSRLKQQDDVRVAIEMIASYGMPVGAEVFETCVWIGRFIERWYPRTAPRLVYRREVKLHLCGVARAKDAHVRQALIDRFGPGKHIAVGLKASPGPLYGLAGDGWAALAVAVTVADETAQIGLAA